MEKKKMFILGGLIAVVLIVVAGGLFMSKGGGNPEHKKLIEAIDQLEDLYIEKKILYDNACVAMPRDVLEEALLGHGEAKAKARPIYEKYEQEEDKARDAFLTVEREKTEKVIALKQFYTSEDCEQVYKDLREIQVGMLQTAIMIGQSGPRKLTICGGPLKDAFDPEFKQRLESILGKKLSKLVDPWGEQYRIGGKDRMIQGASENYDTFISGALTIYSVDKYSKKGYARNDPYRSENEKHVVKFITKP